MRDLHQLIDHLAVSLSRLESDIIQNQVSYFKEKQALEKDVKNLHDRYQLLQQETKAVSDRLDYIINRLKLILKE